MKKVQKVVISLCIVVIVASSVIAYVFLFHWPYEFSYCCTEELTITGVTFQTGNATISVINTGVRASSISSVEVDDVAKTVLATGGDLTGSGPYDLEPGERGTITIGLSWTSGISYTFAVITTEGMKFTYPHTIAP